MMASLTNPVSRKQVSTSPAMKMLDNQQCRVNLDSFFDNKQSASNQSICKAYRRITVQQRITSTGVFKVREVMQKTIEKGRVKYQSFEILDKSRKKVMELLSATRDDIKVFDMSDILIDVNYTNFFYIIGQKEFQELTSMRFPNVRNLVVRLPKPQRGRFERDKEVLPLTREQIVEFARAFPNVETLKMSENYIIYGNYKPFSSDLEADEIEALLSLPETGEESAIPRLPRQVRTLTLAQCKHPYNEKFSKLLKGMGKLQSITLELEYVYFKDTDATQMTACFEGLPLHKIIHRRDLECPGENLDQAFHILSKIRTLTSLDLSCLNVTFEAMKAFASMPNLESFNTKHMRWATWVDRIGRPINPYSVAGMLTLSKSHSLTHLNMHFWGNNNKENLAGIVAILPQIPSLRILDFSDYEFPVNFAESLAKCQRLEELYLKEDGYGSIPDDILGKLKDTKLRKIVFGKEPYFPLFSTHGFEKLVQSKTLEMLDIAKFKKMDVLAIIVAAKQARIEPGMKQIFIFQTKLPEIIKDPTFIYMGPGRRGNFRRRGL